MKSNLLFHCSQLWCSISDVLRACSDGSQYPDEQNFDDDLVTLPDSGLRERMGTLCHTHIIVLIIWESEYQKEDMNSELSTISMKNSTRKCFVLLSHFYRLMVGESPEFAPFFQQHLLVSCFLLHLSCSHTISNLSLVLHIFWRCRISVLWYCYCFRAPQMAIIRWYT